MQSRRSSTPITQVRLSYLIGLLTSVVHGLTSFSALLNSLYHIYPLIENCSAPRKAPYQNTWDLLRESVQSWPLAGARGGFIAFPMNVSDAYLTLLQEDDWMARILFLHYGVGLHLLSGRWYVGDWGRRLVAAVVESAGKDIPPEWIDIVMWTQQAVGLDTVRDVVTDAVP